MTEAITHLQKALSAGKIAGSWLITGGQADEQEAFARQACALLLGEAGDFADTFHPDVKWLECGLTEEAKKEIQKSILAGKAVEDLADLSRKREITVEDIRAGIQFLALKSAPDRWRILIINPADKMNENAANALLKALEEPGDRSVILLLCRNGGRVLPTIKSRCRKIVLKPLSQTELAAKIKELYPAIDSVDLVVKLADGSLGIAKNICDHDGLALYQRMVSLLVPTDQLSAEAVKSLAADVSDDPVAFELLQKFLADWIWNQVRHYAVTAPFIAEDYMDLRREIMSLFADIDRIYLDKKQVIQTVFFKIAEVLS